MSSILTSSSPGGGAPGLTAGTFTSSYPLNALPRSNKHKFRFLSAASQCTRHIAKTKMVALHQAASFWDWEAGSSVEFRHHPFGHSSGEALAVQHQVGARLTCR